MALPINWFDVTIVVRDLMEEAFSSSKLHGQWDGQKQIPEKLAVIHAHLSGALNELGAHPLGEIRIDTTTGKPDGFSIELAGAVIGILDLCGAYNVNLAAAIKARMAYDRG